MYHVVIKSCSQDSENGETAKVIRRKPWERKDLSKGIPIQLPEGILLGAATLDTPQALASLYLQLLKSISYLLKILLYTIGAPEVPSTK